LLQFSVCSQFLGAADGALGRGTVASQPREPENSLNLEVLSRVWKERGGRRSCGALGCLPRRFGFRGPGRKAAKL